MGVEPLIMYVLASPCISDPSLRAEGITGEDLKKVFQKVIARCEQFGIDIIYLPCPETLYLGKIRKPAHFLDAYNTPEFAILLGQLADSVTQIIKKKGPPLCLLGIDSSPTCGVTKTYYGSIHGEPDRRDGRGAFFTRFLDIPAVDVRIFAQYRIYLAAPLFSAAEREYNLTLKQFLNRYLFEIYLPQEEGDTDNARYKDDLKTIFEHNMQVLQTSDLILAVIDGADADSGTAWEMGYAYAHNIPIFALRTDFRMAGKDELVNLMLEQSATVIREPHEILENLGLCPLFR